LLAERCAGAKVPLEDVFVNLALPFDTSVTP